MATTSYQLEFEKPLHELEKRIRELEPRADKSPDDHDLSADATVDDVTLMEAQ